MNKKRWIYVLAGAGGYLLLLLLLVLAEAHAPGASITTLGQAFWFSLVTLTTVGYGDCSPVTPMGRVIGAVLILLSTGVLALLLGAAVSLAAGRLLPRVKLWCLRRRPWYIFSEANREADALAEALAVKQPLAVAVFCRGAGQSAPGGPGRVCIQGDPEEALRSRGSPEGATLLFLGQDGCANYTRALAAAGTGARVCCQTAFAPDRTPDNVILFDRQESCARLYWQSRPLTGERDVVLIGLGGYGSALLEQGLLVNIRGKGRRVTYHVFGDDGSFLRRHPYLGQAVDLDGSSLDGDALVFHTEEWDAGADLLARAGRIILCGDSDEENLERFRVLRRCFAAVGEVHLRLSRPLEDAAVFGADRELFTPELVLRTRLDAAARAMHEIYRESAGGEAPAWEELGDFLRRSNRAAADHLLTKARLLLEDDGIPALTGEVCRLAYERYLAVRGERADFFRELEHLRWMRFYALSGWRYAPVRDNARRLHPDLRPYGRLTSAEQAKDDYAWELLGALAGRLEGAARGGNP